MEASRPYVCVRVTDMTGVDLSFYPFDFDLTFAALLMNPDGTIYHRYSTRVWEQADKMLSMESLVRVMRETVDDHKEYMKNPSPPKAKPRETIDALWREARPGNRPDCFHCHMIGEARGDIAKKKGRWSRNVIYKFPVPEQIGLTLDRDDQTLVTNVASRTAASKAGLKKGDRLVRVGGERVRTSADVQWWLDQVPDKSGTIEIEFTRKDKPLTAKVRVRKGWRVADPLIVSWRSTMWTLEPAPGLGGPKLNADELESNGLKRDAFAFKVQYIVTWGKNSRYGRNVQKAGIRKNDIIVVKEKEGLRSMQHFHAWFRLTKKPGDKLALERIRNGIRKKIDLPVIR